ncbi:MAG: TIM barrel protein [Phycisphaerales bacterium]
MMFSLNTNSIRSVLKRRGARAISPMDLPKYTMDQFGLRAINFSTDQLAGLTPKDLELIRDSGDRIGCSCLLVSQTEPLERGDVKGDKALEGIERMTRVLKAASLMGCNAVSVSIKSKDSDAAFEQATESMKHILHQADRAEINVLVSPMKGLTEDPERLTDLLKGIGGFRIGTMPDFVTSTESGDPVAYLKKITPYASVVNASTLGFDFPEPEEVDESAPVESESQPVDKAVPSTDEPVSEVAAAVDQLEADLAKEDGAGAPGELSGLAALAAELEEMMLEDDPVPVHVGYELPPLVGAIAAVGFDGTISLDYRGDGDGTLGVIHAKEAIEAALEALKD